MADTLNSDEQKPLLWRQRWFQQLLAVLLVLAIAALIVPPLLALVYTVRPVLLPVLIGVALAYAADPLARWAKRRLKIPRPASAILIMAAIVLIVLGLMAYLVPKLVVQIDQLIRAMPDYMNQIADRLDIDLSSLMAQVQEMARSQLGATTQPAKDGSTAALDFGAIAREALAWLGTGIEFVGSTIGFTTYLGLAIVVVAFCFFFFLWKFESITGWFVPFIPVKHRDQTLDILDKMDASVSGFIRGRLIQATVIAVVLSVGWWLAGVPYWLLLGVGAGFLNLIPYAAVIGWPLAVGLAWLDAVSGTDVATSGAAETAVAVQAGFSVWHVFIWPSVVYILAQSLDGWVVEPLVQGKATNLDPLTVLLVVLVGGYLAGLLGLLIAIPAAACIKILAQEVLLPRLRNWAATESPG